MKFITGIVAFTLTFGFSVALIGFPKTDFVSFEIRENSQEQQNIASLLRRDIRNGRERDKKLDDMDLLSEKPVYSEAYIKIVNEYVDKSSSMDDADLPADFQVVWHEHMQAWQDYADFINSSENIKKSSCLLSRLEDNYNQEISVTWYEVLRVGREYGANPY